MTFCARHGAAAAALLLIYTIPLSAQQAGRPVTHAVPVAEPPVVDGVLDEAEWAAAQPLSGFVQRVPSDGQPASERTEIRILHDSDALYVGAWLFDSRPSDIVRGEAIRDYDLKQSDAVVLLFDTFRDEQNAFVFGTNPVGIEYDGQVANSGQGGGRFFGGGGGNNRRQQSGSGGGFNLNWDASWSVATTVDGEGWYAEFRIPFSTLRYADGDDQTWGLNVERRVRRLNEQSFWAPIPREFDEYRLNYAGTLEGLAPPQRRLVRVTPYVLQRGVRDWQAGDPEFDYPTEVGGDAKVLLTQGLTLDLTVNTDFAQVEVDEVQTNLTRFDLFFPEKRPFFLENAGFFQVGTGGADLFFSRSIGISESGAVPILGGGRISGRAGGLNVGAFHIETDDLDTAIPQNQYSMVRLARELPNRSRVGGAFMRRASDLTNDWNRTYVVDGQLGVGEALSINSFFARTETPGRTGRDHAFNASGSYTTRSFNSTFAYREFGEDFNPEMGFLPREGYRYVRVHNMVYVRPERWGLREVRPHISYTTYRDIETGFEESTRVHIDSHLEFQDGMQLDPALNWVREGLEEDFEIAPGIFVPVGMYTGWEAGWVFHTNESARFSFNGGMNAGSFLSGDRVNPWGTFTLRPNASFSTAVRFDYSDVNLREGDFEATLLGLRVSYFITPRIYVQSLTQYSDRADAWSTNVRFGWLDDAGSGLFVVFNQASGFDTLSQFRPLNRAFTVKYSKLFDVLRW